MSDIPDITIDQPAPLRRSVRWREHAELLFAAIACAGLAIGVGRLARSRDASPVTRTWSGTWQRLGETTYAREVRFDSGARCVIVRGGDRGDISCDWNQAK